MLKMCLVQATCKKGGRSGKGTELNLATENCSAQEETNTRIHISVTSCNFAHLSQLQFLNLNVIPNLILLVYWPNVTVTWKTATFQARNRYF
jgi:hypothetical protein